MTALFLPSANWYCSQLCAWGSSLSVSEKVYFAYGCKSQVAIYEMDKTSEGGLSEPKFYADFTRGKHDKRVTSVAFMTNSAGELVLICSGEEGSIQLWDIVTKKMTERYKKHKTEIMAVSTLNGTSIVAGDRNGVVSLNQRETGLITVNTPLAGDCIYCLAGAPGVHNKLVIGYRSGQVIIWDVVSSSIAFRLKSHDEEVHAVSWYEVDNALYLATSSRDKKLCVWQDDNLVMESTLPKAKKNMSTHQMNRLWFTHTWIESDQGLRIISSSPTGDLYSWEWSTKKKRSKLSVAPIIINARHSRQIFNITAFSLGKAGAYVATSSMDRDVRILHLPTMSSHFRLSGLGGHVYTIEINADGILAAGIGDNTIRFVHDLNKPQSTSSMLWKGLQSKITTIAWHPLCSTILAYGCEDGYFGYYNTTSNQLVRFKSYHSSMVHQVSWKTAMQAKPTADDWLQALNDIKQGNRDALDDSNTVASSSGVELWSCAADGSLWSVNPDTPESTAMSINKRWGVENVTSFAWKQNSDICVIGTGEGIVQIYDKGVKVHQYMNHTKSVSKICWFETLLATCSYDAMIFLYDMSEPFPSTYQQAFKGHGSGVTDLAWSPTGKYLASASIDGTVQVWPLNPEERGYNFRQHSGRVLTVAWRDPMYLVSAGEDQTIRQWKYAEQTFTMPPESKQESSAEKVKDKTKKSSPAPESNWEGAARLLILRGSIIEALRILAKEGKLSSEWISYAPMAGVDAWREFTRLYANQLIASGDYQNAAISWTTIGEVHQAIESLCKGNYWREAIALILLRCSPNDPILMTKQLEYAAYLMKKNEMEEAGHIYSKYNRTDQALACFLKANSPSALEAALNLTTNATIQLDIINRALSLGYTSVISSAIPKVGESYSSQLFLKMYCLFIEADDLSTGVVRGNFLDDVANCMESLPPLLQSIFNDHKKSWFYHCQLHSEFRDILAKVDEDLYQGFIESTYQSYIRSAPNESKVLLNVSYMALEVYHGCLISAFETWAAVLTDIMKSTEDEELMKAFAIVFPFGVTMQPPHTGELGDDAAAAKELWASFLLLQSIALARVVRQKDNILEQQESLLFLTQWINREFSPEVLMQFSPEIVRLTQVASNELSLLYHQLVDPMSEAVLSESHWRLLRLVESRMKLSWARIMYIADAFISTKRGQAVMLVSTGIILTTVCGLLLSLIPVDGEHKSIQELEAAHSKTSAAASVVSSVIQSVVANVVQSIASDTTHSAGSSSANAIEESIATADEVSHSNEAHYHVAESIWTCWLFIADPGAQTEEKEWKFRIPAFFISVHGMVLFFVILGFVVDSIREKMDDLKKGRSNVIESGHSLLLGWTDKSISLIKQLCLANESEGGGVIVILAEAEKEFIEGELETQIEEHEYHKTKVVVRSGSPLIISDLKKVSAHAARSITIMASSIDADKSDAACLRIILSLRGLFKLKGHVVAEIRDVDNEPLVHLVGGNIVETLVSHDIIGRLILLSARSPRLSRVYNSLLGFEGDEFYSQAWPGAVGVAFGNLIERFPLASPIGVKSKAGKIAIKPNMDYIIQEGDEIIVLAEDNDSYAFEAPVAIPPLPQQKIPQQIQEKEKILICGWRRDIQDMLVLLDDFLIKGSEVHLLSEISLEDREAFLAQSGVEVDSFENCVFKHHIGSTSVRRFLEPLPLEEYTSIMVLCDFQRELDILNSDSHSLATVLLLRNLQKNKKDQLKEQLFAPRVVDAIERWTRNVTNKCPCITEILDPRTQKTVATNSSISAHSDFVMSNELVSCMLAMISESRSVKKILHKLLSPKSSTFTVQKGSRYCASNEVVSYFQLSKRLIAINELLVGYLPKIISPLDPDMVVLNPKNKSITRRWSEYDLIVITGGLKDGNRIVEIKASVVDRITEQLRADTLQNGKVPEVRPMAEVGVRAGNPPEPRIRTRRSLLSKTNQHLPTPSLVNGAFEVTPEAYRKLLVIQTEVESLLKQYDALQSKTRSQSYFDKRPEA